MNNKAPPYVTFSNPCSGHLSLYDTSSSSFLGFTAQRRPWAPPQNPAEFLGGFSTIFFFTR
jgi:hypothetical protein